MATEYLDYRGYRLAVSALRGDGSWTVMINPIDALRALPQRPEAATRDSALSEARLIVDRSMEPAPAPRRSMHGFLARLRGAPAGRAVA